MSMHVYRFHDKVAISPPEGPTFYVDIDAAREVIQALDAVRLDLQRFPFSTSRVGTVRIEEKQS